MNLLVFAHHMGVEIFGREYAPQGMFQHVCVFLALGTIAATSAFGTWVLFCRALEALKARERR